MIPAALKRCFQLQPFYRGLRVRPERKLPPPKMEKRLDVAILGPPNAGKSVLINTMVKTKLAATSRKRHTTRREILGVFNHRNVQLAFYDTPGYLSRSESNTSDVKVLRNFSLSTVRKADVVLLVMDAARDLSPTQQDSFAEMVRVAIDNAEIEVILVLNKVDLVVPKPRLLDTTRKLVSLVNGVKLGPDGADRAQLDTTTFMISALQNDGVIDLKNYLISLARPRVWLVPKGQGPTLLSLEERVEQIVLEMLLDHTHEEIPYIADVECISIKGSTVRDKRVRDSNSSSNRNNKNDNISSNNNNDNNGNDNDNNSIGNSDTAKKKSLRIDVNIWVDTGAQERIIVGQQGRTLVKIRAAAVDALEKILDRRVILFLWAKRRTGQE